MKTFDFNTKPNADQLNEAMFKQFGAKVNFDKYSREQLENYRNLLRTKVFQQESTSGFNSTLKDDSYQKDKYMLGVLNTKIKEMVGESKVLAEKAVSKKQQQAAGIALAAKKSGKKLPGKGASAEMSKMNTKELEKFAGTKHKGLPTKKKTNESVETMAELAHHHALEYMKAHRAGKLDQAMHHKSACESCGGRIHHGGMGECWNTHVGIGGGMAYQVQEGGMMPVQQTAQGMGGQPPGAVAEGKKAKKDYDGDGKKESPKDEVWGSRAKAAAKSGKPFEESAKPDFLDMDKDGNKKEPMKKAVADKKVKEGFPTVDDAKKAAAGTASMKQGEKKKSSTGGEITKTATGLRHTAGKNYGGHDAPKTPDSDKKSKKVKEDMISSRQKVKENLQIAQMGRLQYLREDEEEKAKTITAGTDMVNDFTTWMTRVGQYQTKSMIEIADKIRSDFGQMESEAFKQAVAPALESALQALTQTRETISTAVATLASGGTPSPMGGAMPPEPGMEQPGMEQPGMEEPGMDEFGAADAAAGGAEAAGRMQRESRQLFARKLSEAHTLMKSLSKK
jgi:hypothetical protein